jgi:hypothetical protein
MELAARHLVMVTLWTLGTPSDLFLPGARARPAMPRRTLRFGQLQRFDLGYKRQAATLFSAPTLHHTQAKQSDQHNQTIPSNQTTSKHAAFQDLLPRRCCRQRYRRTHSRACGVGGSHLRHPMPAPRRQVEVRLGGRRSG